MNKELATTIHDIVQKGKGILAADESTKTCTKRFESLKIPCTDESRRDYREMLFRAPGISKFISGVILYEETLKQKSADGGGLPEILKKQGVVVGIKVDTGLIALPNTNEQVTQGLDGLPERLAEYKKYGARFAKWRAVFSISDHTPSRLAIRANAESLARYAAICQNTGVVPIVEPEVLLDGDHTLERSFVVHEEVLHHVFHALHHHHVVLEHMILKPSMIVSGKDASVRASVQQVAEATVRVLRRTVPSAVPSINFLSGGQTPEEATHHLQLMNLLDRAKPWLLSFSYGRALQDPALKAWGGKNSNAKIAQEAFLKRARLNGAAVEGKYTQSMEK